MKILSSSIIVLLLVAWSGEALAQLSRANERTWHAVRGGLFIGINRTFHEGDVPFQPVIENTHFGTAASTNFTFGISIEKALSRLLLIGARVRFDPMSTRLVGDFEESYRVGDSQNNPYDVVRTYDTDYVLRYLSFSAFARFYPAGGPGFYIAGGGTLATLLNGSYIMTPVILEPEWARGSKGRTEKGDIPDVQSLRHSLYVSVGYEVYYIYGFVAPEIAYEFGLNNVVDASYANSWNVSNLRITLHTTFPLPY